MTPEMKKQYDEYLTSHINNVSKGFAWLKENLPEVLDDCSDYIEDNFAMHDRSKYSDEEYVPYANYFYGEKSTEVEKEFNYAWLHHIHQNPHHWQYWILVHDDEPTEILDMPYDYIIEMICDWWSFSWKTGKLDEIFSWYDKHKEMQLSEKTRKIVENILEKINKKLEELK